VTELKQLYPKPYRTCVHGRLKGEALAPLDFGISFDMKK